MASSGAEVLRASSFIGSLAPHPWDVADPWSQYRITRAVLRQSPALQPANKIQPTMHASKPEKGLATLQAQHLQSVKDREAEKQLVSHEFRSPRRKKRQNLHTSMTSQVQTSIESLRVAQQQQEQQLHGSIEELKLLLLRSTADEKPRKEASHDS